MILRGPYRRPPTAGLYLAAVLAGVLVGQLLTGCRSAPAVIWPIAVDCAARDGTAVIGTVARVLIGGGNGWRKELEDLARTAGADFVACAVAQLVDDWRAPGAASLDPRTQAGRERGEAFLAEKKVLVQR